MLEEAVTMLHISGRNDDLLLPNDEVLPLGSERLPCHGAIA